MIEGCLVTAAAPISRWYGSDMNARGCYEEKVCKNQKQFEG